MDALVFVLSLWGTPVSAMVTPSPAVCEEIVATALDDIWIAGERHPFGPAVEGAIARASDWSAECRPVGRGPHCPDRRPPLVTRVLRPLRRLPSLLGDTSLLALGFLLLASMAGAEIRVGSATGSRRAFPRIR